MAFVHLHNHSDFSLLDAATRIGDMVDRAVELGMPALALTDHGYMFGIPNFDLACRGYNHKQPDYKQWAHDREALEKGWEIEEPEPDAPDAGPHDFAHAQWEKDMEAWNRAHDLADVDAVRPDPLIRPIFGCEAYFITDDMIEKKPPQRRYHLLLIAKNQTGYVNLMKIMSESANQQFYYKPRTTLEMLERYHEGLICTSACVQGIIQQNIFDNNIAEAERWAKRFQDIFGDDYYLEIQDHGLTFRNGWTDRRLSEQIVEIGAKLGIKVVATNDNHYLLEEDARTQDIISCIGTADLLETPGTSRKKMSGTEFYIKSEAEMRSIFDWCPEACDNTVELANKCSVELEWDQIILPNYPLDPGETEESQFRRECEIGLARRYGENWKSARPDVVERFEYEYGIICEKGFATYFLIVADYVKWAKEQGIGVGPGRGSAAGSIVAYAMDITTFDPIENGLLFERFLSPERSEMPDIDIDFDDERRPEVIDYVRERYGAEKVCQVITYSTIKAKQAINDAARVLGHPVYVAQRLSKMVSNSPGVKLKQVLARTEAHPEYFNQDFADAYENDADSRQIIDAALSIEGLTRGEGVHACATLICRDPINDHVPTKLDTKGGIEITQYEGTSIAGMGLLKMDFLGLRTLTVISKARQNILANHGVDIDPDTIPFDDPATFELMAKGHTAGVFQIESAGMTATIKNMKPTEYKHVVALIALYRPGPLQAGMVTSYINRMNGREAIVSYDDRLSSILEETYGTLVYQEQIMQISMAMSGFSAGESDKVRKAVAKKKIKLMTETVQHWDDGKDETMYDHWMNGATRNDYPRATAQKIWDDVLEFASYAFNKSHSAGYAILVMQTAYLKAHYPREYMAAVLTSYMGKTDKIVHYVNSCRHEGIQILPPDINESGRDFTATPEGIRFGFAGIRGVGEGVADAIMEERERGGAFVNLHDFADRVSSSAANRRVVEALIRAGAFDSTGYTRMQLMYFVDKNNPDNILDAAARRQKDKASGQSSLFDMFGDVEGSGFEADIPEPDGVEWDRHVKLAQEKEVLGIYVSDHPLRPYEYALSQARDCTIAELSESTEMINPATGASTTRFKVKEGKNIWIAGMVSELSRRTTKNGDAMAIVTLEDMEGEVTCVVFPRAYKKYAGVLAGQTDEVTGASVSDVFVRMQGRLERDDRGTQLMVSAVEPIELDDENNRPKVLEILMPSRLLSREFMERMNRVFGEHRGMDRVELRVEESGGQTMRMELPSKVDASSMVLGAILREMLGAEGRVQVV